jgi:hypothetical protein
VLRRRELHVDVRTDARRGEGGQELGEPQHAGRALVQLGPAQLLDRSVVAGRADVGVVRDHPDAVGAAAYVELDVVGTHGCGVGDPRE